MAYTEYGDENVLQPMDLPEPTVGPGEVLVRVTRASVNPVDWKVMSGALEPLLDAHFPAVPGWDVTGVVEKLGPDVPEFAVGDRVASYARKTVVSGGTFAQFVAVPADIAARVPDGVSDEQAGALPLTGLTARRAVDALQLRPGDTVVLHAASGGVGYLASQLAVATGATVIGTASPEHFGKLEAVGVRPVSYGEGLVDRIRELAPEGVAAVADFAGGVLDVTLEILGDGGRHVSITDPEAAEHGGRWLWVRPDGPRLAELLGLVAEGSLRLDIDRTLPLEQLPEAFRLSRRGEAKGKLVIAVAD